MLGKLLLEQGMQGAEKSFLGARLRCLSTDKVCNDNFNLSFWRSRKRGLEERNVGDARGALSEDLPSLEVLY